MAKQSKIEQKQKELHELILKHKNTTEPEIVKLQAEIDYFNFGVKYSWQYIFIYTDTLELFGFEYGYDDEFVGKVEINK